MGPGFGCVPRGAAPNAGPWSTWAGPAVHITCRRVGRGLQARVSGFGTCALRTLAEWLQSTRLETRTKESNMYASRWVVNP